MSQYRKYARGIVRSGLPIRTKKSTPPKLKPGSVLEELDSWAPDTKLDPAYGGRPSVKKKRRRECPVTVAFTRDEVDVINAYVKALRCSRAAFVRTAVFMAMGKNPLD